MTQQKDDCYFFYYSTCIKGENCPFRHEPAALGKEEICSAWLKGACIREACPERHMVINKNRSQTPCFWETQPGGCQKPHCVFFHRRSNPIQQRVVSAVQNPVASLPAPEAQPVPTEVMLLPEKARQPTATQNPVVPQILAPTAALPVVTKGAEPDTSAFPCPGMGSRVVMTSTNSVKISPMTKVILKEGEPKKHVKERIGQVVCQKSEDQGLTQEDKGIVVKSLEQIHREKALASMKKKQEDRSAQIENNDVVKVPVVQRKIVIKRDMKSEGEISDDSDSSNGCKVEATSDTENGRVRLQGDTRGRIVSVLNNIVVPLVTEKDRPAQRVQIKPLVSKVAASPSKAKKKHRESVNDLSKQLSLSRLARGGGPRAIKPTIEIYRPPRALNLEKEPQQEPQQKLSPKMENKVSRIRMRDEAPARKRVGLQSVLTKVAEEKNAPARGLLKKPKENQKRDEGKPLEEVRVKTLDEILAEKRKKSPPQSKTVRARPLTYDSVRQSSSSANQGKGLTIETLRTLRRKRNAEAEPVESSAPPNRDTSVSHFLKRRRTSMAIATSDPSKLDSENNHSDRAGGDAQVPEMSTSAVAVSNLKEERTTKGRKDAGLSFSLDDDETFDDFLLEGEESYVNQTINDDELFREIQSLL